MLQRSLLFGVTYLLLVLTCFDFCFTDEGISRSTSSLRGVASSWLLGRRPSSLLRSVSRSSTPSMSHLSIEEACLQKHGYFVAPATIANIATKTLRPVSDHGRRILGISLSCSWSHDFKSCLVSKLGRANTNWMFVKYNLGKQDALLRIIRANTSLGLTYYQYVQVATAVRQKRSEWDEKHPNKKVHNWEGKSSTVIMTDFGFRDITTDEL